MSSKSVGVFLRKTLLGRGMKKFLSANMVQTSYDYDTLKKTEFLWEKITNLKLWELFAFDDGVGPGGREASAAAALVSDRRWRRWPARRA